MSDGRSWLQWFTQEDEKVCGWCAAMHGLTFEPGLEPPQPAHPHCRCFYLPVPAPDAAGLLPGETDPEPVPLGEPGEGPTRYAGDNWLEKLPAAARIGWERYVAWLRRTVRPVPKGLALLIPAADAYNKAREKDEQERAFPWWWFLIPEEEREEALEDEELYFYEELGMDVDSSADLRMTAAGDPDGRMMLFTHNSETAESEPAWGGLDKTKLPRAAHADHGEAGTKSTWKYPHHWVRDGGDLDENGVYTSGTMLLHRGGLNAAWSAAQGARSGEEASAGVKAHLQRHRSALGVGKEEEMARNGDSSADLRMTNDGGGDSSADLRMTSGEEPARPLRMTAGRLLQLQSTGNGRREYLARFARAGQVKAAGNQPGWFALSEDALQMAAEGRMFENVPSFLDHPGLFDNPALADMAGVTRGATWNAAEQSVDGMIRLYPTPAGQVVQSIFDTMLADAAEGIEPPDIGLSLVFWPDEWQPAGGTGEPEILLSFRKVDSVDFVFGPAADGRIKQALSVFGAGAGGREMSEKLQNSGTGEAPPSTPVAPTPAVAPGNDWVTALQRAAVPAMLAASDLPAASRERLAAGSYDSPAALDAAVQAERAYLARLAEDQVIRVGGIPPRDPRIVVGRSGLDQITLAVDGLMAGTRPPDGIQPLTGIRELYHLLSGDYEMSGVFRPERVYMSNVTTATMAGLVANALNKRIINMFQGYPQWWLPIVTIEDFDSLQDVRWITLGGVGELPTVTEGATYTELTWDDQTETDSFVKKGGYLGITLEAIDKDDTYRLRAAPRALAQAAYLTLAKAISAIFTGSSGTGPTMTDTYHLFDASNHSNLLTTALSHSAYLAVRLAMRKQTELNSGERLGSLTAPKFLLVPPDLEITALQVLATEQVPCSGDWNANPLAEGDSFDARMRAARSRVIVVDLWTDTNDWAAVADPLLYPSIGLGFRYGRTPEIFSVASPTAGLMFSNDVMPIKVRFFFAVGPTDWRGVHKSNV